MKIMNELEAEDFLEKHKLPVAKRIVAKTASQAVAALKKLNPPVALKIIGKDILHKSDVGGVKLNLRTEQEVIKAFSQIKKIKGFQAVLIQHYREGAYLLIGLKKDPVFNHAIVVGSGGIYTEIIKDTSIRICPINRQQAGQMLKELKMHQILSGARGKKFNISRIINIILNLSNLAKKYKNIKELDINPLIITDKEAVIADARIIFE